MRRLRHGEDTDELSDNLHTDGTSVILALDVDRLLKPNFVDSTRDEIDASITGLRSPLEPQSRRSDRIRRATPSTTVANDDNRFGSTQAGIVVVQAGSISSRFVLHRPGRHRL